MPRFLAKVLGLGALALTGWAAAGMGGYFGRMTREWDQSPQQQTAWGEEYPVQAESDAPPAKPQQSDRGLLPFLQDQGTVRRSSVRYPGDEGKNHNRIKAIFKPVVAPANPATVVIRCNGQDAALGTIMSADGQILTKASELQGVIECQLRDGRKLPVKVVGVMREHDLALLEVEAKDLPTVKWQSGDAPMVGSFLVTTGAEDEPLAIGVVSVSARKISAPSGILGILLAQSDDGPRIERVLDNSAAAAAGLKINDVILKVNDQEIKTRDALIELIGNFRPGDQLQLKIKRGADQLELPATLGRPESGRPANARGGRRTEEERLFGDLSERRGGFPNVMQHDTVLRPFQCGGPVVDLDGQAVGINIARADRVTSYALPAKLVLTAYEELKAGKFPAPAELKGSNRDRLTVKIELLEKTLAAATEKKIETEKTLEAPKKKVAEAEAALTNAKVALAEVEAAIKGAADAETKAKNNLKAAQEKLKAMPE